MLKTLTLPRKRAPGKNVTFRQNQISTVIEESNGTCTVFVAGDTCGVQIALTHDQVVEMWRDDGLPD